MLKNAFNLGIKMPCITRALSTNIALKDEKSELITMLRKEIKSHTEHADKSEYQTTLASLHKKGFTEVKTNNRSVCLEKKVLSDTLTIYTDFNMLFTKPSEEDAPPQQLQKEDKDSEESKMDTIVGFLATLAKGKSTKGFVAEILVNENGIEVSSIKCHDNIGQVRQEILSIGKAPEEMYGPNYERLDDRLQTALNDYLSFLGLDDETLTYIFEIMAKKEEKCYAEWLNKMTEFL